jgi:hypothetical protein
MTTYVPFTGDCERDFMGTHSYGGNLTEYLDRAFKPNGYTRYLGISDAPWSKNSSFHKFRIDDDYDDHSDIYFRTDNLNIEWVFSDNDNVLLHIPKGFEPMTFSDSDFVIKQCNYNYNLESSSAPIVSFNLKPQSITIDASNIRKTVERAILNRNKERRSRPTQ